MKQAAPSFHLGLIPTYSKELVTVQIIQLADGSRKTLAKVTGPIGDPMEVRIGAKTADRPTLRILPVRAY